jgi:hypothetical protein
MNYAKLTPAEQRAKEKQMVLERSLTVAKAYQIPFTEDWKEYYTSYRLLGFDDKTIATKYKESLE